MLCNVYLSLAIKTIRIFNCLRSDYHFQEQTLIDAQMTNVPNSAQESNSSQTIGTKKIIINFCLLDQRKLL